MESSGTSQKLLKGLLNDFTSTFSLFFSPVAVTVDLMVSRSVPKWSTSNSNGTIGPVCDTMKSTVTVTWIEQVKKA